VITIDVDPVLVHLGPVAISWYGLAIVLAVAVGVWLTLREVRRKGLPSEPFTAMVMWIIVGGLVGARLLHIIDRWDFYAANPAKILAVQNGGLAIVGAILGGALTGGFLAWKQHIPVRRLFDAAAPGIVLGQAIGRFGCLVTGDALGAPTGGNWGIVYQNPGSMAPQLGVAYQPVFLYEQLWDFALFALLWAIRKRLRTDGQLFALYLGLYAAGKFALTFLRTEVVWFWGLQEAQIVSLLAILVSVAWASWDQWRPRAVAFVGTVK
jgi:phosphatidylglycerol---prolipoprotein diacylglyceryl transferase